MEVLDADMRSFLPRGRKPQAVLAILALAGPRKTLRREITDLLWSKRGRVQALASLRQCVYSLRELLQPIGLDLVHTGRDGLELRGDIWVDATSLQQTTEPNVDALDLLRGPLLRDLIGIDPAFDQWLNRERAIILNFAAQMAETLMNERMSPLEATVVAERILFIDPTHQGAWRTLVASYKQLGKYIDTFKAYERCVAALLAEGQTPSPETMALLDGINLPNPENFNILAIKSRSYKRLEVDVNRHIHVGIKPIQSISNRERELAYGLTEEIVTSLARFKQIICFLKSSSEIIDENYKSQEDFTVDGSLRSDENQICAIVRLFDQSGAIVWTRSFKHERKNVLVHQEDVAAQVAAQVGLAVMIHDNYHLEAHAATDPTTHQLMLLAIPNVHRLEKTSFLQSGKLLAAVVAKDPNYAAGCAWWAYWHLLLLGQGWAVDIQAAASLTEDLTQRAITLDPYDPHSLTLAGHIRAFMQGRLDDGLALHERALSINPNLPLAWLFSGLAHTYSGQHSEAIKRINHAKHLSPLDPQGFFFDMGLTLSHMLSGEQDLAILSARSAAQINPRFSATFKALLAAHGQVEYFDENKSLEPLRHLLVLEPSLTVRNALSRSPLTRVEDRSRFADGLSRAGLPK